MEKKRTSIGKWDIALDVLDFDIFLDNDLSTADRNIMVGIFLLQRLNYEGTDKPCHPLNANKNVCGLDLPSLFRSFSMTCTKKDIERSLEKLERLLYLDVYGRHSWKNGKKVYEQLSELSVKFREIHSVIYFDGVFSAETVKAIDKLERLAQSNRDKIGVKAAEKTVEEEKRLRLDKWIKETREQLIKKATNSELNIKRMFDSSKIGYVFQKPFVTDQENIYFVDFYLPSLKLGIEVDGEYHSAKEQRRKDLERTMELEDEFGIRIYRLENRDTSNNKLLKHCLEDILYRRQNELGNAILSA